MVLVMRHQQVANLFESFKVYFLKKNSVKKLFFGL